MDVGPGLRFALALRTGRRLTVGDADAAVGLGVAGMASGHRWRRCSACGFEMLTREERGCPRMLPGRKACGGRLVEVAPFARPAHGERPPDARCCRRGCGRVRMLTTARGEEVCRVCLAELAAAAQQQDVGG